MPQSDYDDREVHKTTDQMVAAERVAPMDKLDMKPMRVPKGR
jgi:hypothetical protein